MNSSPAAALRESIVAPRGPGSAVLELGSRTRSAPATPAICEASQSLTPAALSRQTPVRPPAPAPRGSRCGPRHTGLQRTQRLPGDRHIVEWHLLTARQLLPLLVALSGDHQDVARP